MVLASDTGAKKSSVPKRLGRFFGPIYLRLGWAGQCENLFQLDKLDSVTLCEKACVEDPRCSSVIVIEQMEITNWEKNGKVQLPPKNGNRNKL